jgi:TatA/E family protein of Tat protein translocase
MLSLSPLKLMVIAGVIMLLMGPDKLPEVAQKIGAAWRALKKIQEKVEAEVREVIPDLPSASDIARITRSPMNLLNELAARVDTKDAPMTKPESGDPDQTNKEAPSFYLAPHQPRPSPHAEHGVEAPSDPSLN